MRRGAHTILLFLFLGAAAQSQNRPSPGEPMCGATVVADHDVLRRAYVNTIRAFPDLTDMVGKEVLGQRTAAWEVGDQEVFRTYNFGTEQFDTTRAELKAIGAVSYVWVALDELSNSPDPHVTMAEVDAILNALEERTPASSRDTTQGILQLAREYYGDPPNVGSDFAKGGGDGKTHFLIYDIKDGWSGSGAYYAGYFFRVDVGEGSPGTLLFSNRRDLLYIDSYPGIYFSGTRDPQRPLGTLAHEFQHLIHWNYDPDEIDFFNEGLSEYAEYLCGYGLRSPTLYFSNPNTALLGWNQLLEDYSRAALWTLYVAEQYGETFTRNLTQNVLTGSAGFDAATAQSGLAATFRSTTRNFLLANILQDRSVDSSYGYKDAGAAGGMPALKKDFFGAHGSVSQTALAALAGEYLRFRALDTLRLLFPGTSASAAATAIRFTDGGTAVSDLSLAGETMMDFAGSIRSEAIVNIRNETMTGTGMYTVDASGRSRSTAVLELAHDDGRTLTSSNVLFRSNDTAFVVFSGVEGGRLDSVRLWFESTGSARLAVRIFNPDYDLDNDLLSGLGGGSLMGGESVPFSVTDTGYLATSVNLTGYNIPSGNDFVVQMIYGGGAPNPLLRRDSAQGILSSFLALSSQPTPGRTMYASTGDFYIRAYLSPADSALPPPPYRPTDFALYQNFPNPFPAMSGSALEGAGGTEIQFDLPLPAHVSLTVYDALGRVVAVLLDGEKHAARHSVFFDAHSLASGVYFYRLVTQGFAATRKMIVVR